MVLYVDQNQSTTGTPHESLNHTLRWVHSSVFKTLVIVKGQWEKILTLDIIIIKIIVVVLKRLMISNMTLDTSEQAKISFNNFVIIAWLK